MRVALSCLASLSLSLLALPAAAADFHVDPATGSMNNDGSAQKPWSTLAEVIAQNLVETRNWDSLPYADGKQLVAKNAGAPVKAGDTIWLHSGYHGDVSIVSHYNAQDITIAAAPGQQPRLSRLTLQASSHWIVRGLLVSPSYAPSYKPDTMISLVSHSFQGPAFNLTIEDCSLESVPDTSAWTGDQWLTLPADGISASGREHTIRHNHLHNVRFGLSISASDSLIERNTVDSFGNGDGMRGLGDNSVFQYNLVKNAHHPDPDASKGNHDDGFQSWSVGVDPKDGKSKPGFGVVKGIVLRGNVFINNEKLDEPFASNMQGIGCFDGFYEKFVIENNVIISDTYHGIALYGARDSRIVNNTVLYRSKTKVVPWIKIHDHKDGTPSTGNLVRNNLTTAMAIDSQDVVEDHTLLLKDPAALFVNPAAFDLRLLPGAPAIDQGSSDLAPAADADGIPRPQGAAVDVGAYEWHDGPVAGAGGSGGSGQAGSGQAGSGQAGSAQGGASPAGSGGAGAAQGGAGGSAQAGSGQAGQGGAISGGSGGAQAGGASAAGKSGGPASGGQAGQSAGGAIGTAGQSNAAAAASEGDGGCGCRTSGVASGWGAWGALLALAALVRRRRR